MPKDATGRAMFWAVVVFIMIAILQYYVPANCVKEPTIKEVGIRTGNNDKLFFARDCSVKEEIASCNTSATMVYTSLNKSISMQLNVPLTINFDENSTGNAWVLRTYPNAENIIRWDDFQKPIVSSWHSLAPDNESQILTISVDGEEIPRLRQPRTGIDQRLMANCIELSGAQQAICDIDYRRVKNDENTN